MYPLGWSRSSCGRRLWDYVVEGKWERREDVERNEWNESVRADLAVKGKFGSRRIGENSERYNLLLMNDTSATSNPSVRLYMRQRYYPVLRDYALPKFAAYSGTKLDWRQDVAASGRLRCLLRFLGFGYHHLWATLHVYVLPQQSEEYYKASHLIIRGRSREYGRSIVAALPCASMLC